ncbi:YmaF family protein [Fictibacillus barbaricus]|uniref:YmaF family protein n=2 Tax=Fictibacillus barbaricus TaxID=182136 RepID=UPI0027E588B3|nr:YmaF family protein [Fictibacillus barbaricus]
MMINVKEGGNLVHGHDLKHIKWEGRNVHVHQYSTQTSVNDGHSHTVQGVTSPAKNSMGHVHKYEGTTTFDDGHVHRFSGTTGPPIYLADGTHYHMIAGTTTFNDGHMHQYSGWTGKNY